MTGTSPTAGLSSIATTTVTDIHCSLIPEEFLMAENFRMAVDFRARAGFLILPVFFRVAELLMAADLLAPRRQVFIPVRSAASIMEASRAHFPPAAALASAEALTVEGASMAEEATGEHEASTSGKSTDGERNDARNEE